MLIKLWQALGFVAGGYVSYLWGETDGRGIVGFCVGGLIVFSIPVWIYNWWELRLVRKRYSQEAQRLGLTYGWRRHMPWNAGKQGYTFEQFLDDQRG